MGSYSRRVEIELREIMYERGVWLLDRTCVRGFKVWKRESGVGL